MQKKSGEISSAAIAQFRNDLLQWYLQHSRDLPWRRSDDAYEIWVSEVMLQQTQVVKVLEYYRRFLDAFPDVAALAAADQEDVLKLWQGLGYYARARNLHRAARHLAEHHAATVPDTFEELVAIPGIGPYSAAAVASIAFGEPRAVVDGNVIRVLSRLFLVQDPPRQREVFARLQGYADALLAKESPGDFNQAMMELGATICRPRKPACLICPVRAHCQAQKTLTDPASLPVKPPKKKLPEHKEAVALLWDEGLLLIDKRPQNGLLGGMWEFPAVRLQADEQPQAGLRRLLQDGFGLEVEVGEFFMEVKHAFTHFKTTMQVYHCLLKSGELPLDAFEDWRWAPPAELDYFPFANASRKIIRKLEAEYTNAALR